MQQFWKQELLRFQSKSSEDNGSNEDLLIYECANIGNNSLHLSNDVSLMERDLWCSTVPQCRHMFCKRCIDNDLLQRGRQSSFACPRCGTLLSRNQLANKTLDEVQFDIDTTNRRKVKEIFNKRDADFSNLDAFIAYEEKIEDMIFNLNNGIDVSETLCLMEDYQRENEAIILRNAERNQREALKLQQKLRDEELLYERHREELDALELKELEDAREISRKRNAMMLGDAEVESFVAKKPTLAIQSNKDSIASISVPRVSFVAMLQSCRPLPRIVSKEVSRESSKSESKVALHLAGGYDNVVYFQRNWDVIIQSLSSLISTDTLNKLPQRWEECKTVI